MKIAVVSPYDFSIPGGVNSYALSLARWQRRQGHDVRVIGPASSRNGLTPPDVTVVGRPLPVPAGGTVATIAMSPLVPRALRSLLEEEQFDIVHLHEPLMPLLPLHALRVSTALRVGTFHTAEPLGRRLYRLAGPALARWATRLHAHTAISATARDVAAPFIRGPCEIIPGCIDIDRFARPAPPLPALLDGRRNILFVGRIEPRKGLAVLLQAYGRVRASHHDTRLVVVGPKGWLGCRLERRVRALAWDDVVFTGAVAAADLPRYYQAASVFCAPAGGGEAFGIVLAEAMAAGVPIVASEIPGYRHVIQSQRQGLMPPPHDPARLADAIERLLDDAPLRADLRARGRERVRSFSVESVGQRMLDLYDRRLSEQRSQPTAMAGRP